MTAGGVELPAEPRTTYASWRTNAEHAGWRLIPLLCLLAAAPVIVPFLTAGAGGLTLHSIPLAADPFGTAAGARIAESPMSKGRMGVALAAVVCTAGVSAAVYFGLRGRFTSIPPEVKKPEQAVKPEEEEPADASLYRPAPVSLSAASAFLYTGKTAWPQVGVDRTALKRRGAAVVRGQVRTADGKPLAGVEISIPGQPEVGRTHTDAAGGFDLAVNGGGPVVVSYRMKDFLPAQRQIAVPWQDYAWAPDVVLIPPGDRLDAINLPAQDAALRGPPVATTTAAGGRRSLCRPTSRQRWSFPTATSRWAGSRCRPPSTASGRTGRRRSGTSPPGAGYCYAVDVSADEGQEPGAVAVKFNKPLLHYVENFLKLPAGTILPLASYDTEQSVWVPAPARRVIGVLGVKDGLAEFLDGKGQAADAAAQAAIGVSEVDAVGSPNSTARSRRASGGCR